MKTIFLLASLISILSFRSFHQSKSFLPAINDTTVIPHVLDGAVNEWPMEKFEEDKSTSIKYAVDNDAQNLYVAMIIPEFATQMKMMRQGMELYVDIKGKKKQGKGIEFPLKSETTFSGGGVSNGVTSNQQNTENRERTFDKAAIRSRYAMNLFSMKLFGFNDEIEPTKQGLSLEGSANIGFSWDSSDVMFVEYRIPFSILDNESLNQKTISVGWKLNGVEVFTTTTTTTTTRVVSSSAGTRNARSTPPTNTSSSRPSAEMQNLMREQFIWTKYTINIPSN